MKNRIFLTSTILLFLSSTVSFACGPHFPNSYIVWGHENYVLNLPRVLFFEGLKLVENGSHGELIYSDKWQNEIYEGYLEPGFSTPYTNHWQRTLEADLTDLKAALEAKSTPTADIEELLQAYQEMRLAMKVHADGSEYDTDYGSRKNPDPFDLSPYRAVLDRIPAEFACYVEAAAAYRAGDLEGSFRILNRLLLLPEDERTYRSTWAAFMLGKTRITEDPVHSIYFFEETRRLAGAGFHDSLNLSDASAGWQARAELDVGRYHDAILHYYRLFRSGETMRHMFGSLPWACVAVFYADRIDPDVVNDPITRKVVTAWLRSETRNTSWFGKWFEAIRDSGVTLDPGETDQLAWMAYKAGDMEQAKLWLALAPEPGPEGKWVQSKLLFREGKIDEGMQILQSLAGQFPCRDGDNVKAELGVLQLGRKEFVQALDAFVRCGYWQDAGYIADRVLTVEELEQYVKREQESGRLDDVNIGLYRWSERKALDGLRTLLARRLMRNGQMNDALQYYPETFQTFGWYSEKIALKEIAERYSRHLSAAYDKNKPKRQRAENLYEAAHLTRKYGMELLGTEEEPDWAIYGGSFAPSGATKIRLQVENRDVFKGLNPALVSALSPSVEEKQRGLQSAPTPDIRFHYRDIASEMMWECAQMLPNNDPLTARALYYGGMFIKYRDSKEADRFYKALVRRCRKLPIGRQADECRWFPKDPQFE